MNKDKYINIGIAFFLSLLYICFANYYSFPWCDEIYFSGPAANFISRGEWFTAGIANPYSPLYSLLLAGWFLIFGVSHLAAVSLEVLIAFAVYIVLYSIIEKRSLFKKTVSYYFLLPLFWFGFYLPTAFTMGRVDMLALLLILALVDGFVPHGNEYRINYWKLMCVAILLPFTAIYPLPFICYILLFTFIICRDNRKKIFWVGVCIMLGFFVGLFITGIFAYYYKFLKDFLGWIFGMESAGRVSFFEKVLHAYKDIPTLVLFGITILCVAIRKHIRTPKSIYCFVLLIPFFMTIAGRYERYYWWMMYIPTVVLFIEAIEFVSYKKALMSLALVSIVCISSQVYLINYPHRYSHDYFTMNMSKDLSVYKSEQSLANELVEKYEHLISEHKNAVFVSELFYYELFNRAEDCWYGIRNHSFVSHDRTKFYWRIYEDYIRNREYREPFPSEGVLFSLSKEKAGNVFNFLDEEQYTITKYEVEKHPEAVVLVFKK